MASIIFWLFSSLAFAAVSNITIDANTASNIDDTDPANIIVFGGAAGTCTGTSDSVCDSCETVTSLAAPASCNSRSIHAALDLHLSFTVDTVPTGAEVIIMAGDGNPLAVTDKTPTANVAANTTLFIKVPWTNLCGTGGCTAALQKEIQFGISNGTSSTDFADGGQGRITIKFRPGSAAAYHSDGSGGTCADTGEGFCDFTVYPGDEKAYIEDLLRPSVGPSDGSGIKWHAVRIYYQPVNGAVDFTQISPSTAQYKDLSVQNKENVATNVQPGYVDGLSNETEYMFMMATVDEAQNVNFFSDPTNFLDPNFHTAMPGEVVGLLEDKGCFIATAAFGSADDPQVYTLRQFRDQFLKTNSLGREFVDFYYEYSPAIADIIAKNETLRVVVRAALWPFVGFAKMSLSFGMLTALMVLAGLVLAVFKGRRQIKNKVLARRAP